MKKLIKLFLALVLALSMVVSVTEAKDDAIVLDSLIQTTKIIAGKEIEAKNDYASYKWYVGDILQNDTDNTFVPTTSQYESWIKVEAYNEDGELVDEDTIYFSKLPVVYINTDDGEGITSKEEYKSATLYIQGNEIYDAQYNGITQIKGRGNSSWDVAKKPYKLKLDTKTDLFGMGKNKHWVLLASFTDESNMRNKVAQDIAGQLGVIQMELTWVDVILNGEYIGLYELGEHLRVDSGSNNRVDITDWEDIAGQIAKEIRKSGAITKDEQAVLEEMMCEDLSWATSDEVVFNGVTYKVSDYYELPSINGGYLFELDTYYDEVSKFTTKNGVKVMINTPENLYTNQDMMDYCETLWNDFEEAYTAVDGYNSKGIHYSEISDVDSMVAYWLAQEIFGNNDSRGRSRFAYQEVGGLLEWGPGWDYDYGGGVTYLNCDGDPSGWKASTTNNGYPVGYAIDGAQAFFREWTNDPLFVSKAIDAYWKVREFLQTLVDNNGIIDQYTDYIKEAALTNQDLWYEDMAAYYIVQLTIPHGFNYESKYFKNYMTERLAWIDEQFSSLESAMASLKTSYSTTQYNITNDLTLSAVNIIEDTISTNAKATGILYEDTDLSLSLTKSASVNRVKIYINGIYYTSTKSSEVSVNASDLNNDGSKNVINAIAYDKSGNVVSQSCITIIVNGQKPHEHTYEFVSDTATYTTQGIKTYECKECKEIYTEVSDVLALPFKDVNTSKWYYPYIAEVYEKGIMTGTSETTFKPSSSITRGQLATILYRCEGSQEVSKTDYFSDVAANKYYTHSISWCKEAGIVQGYSDGTFKPSKDITRQELAIMLRNYAAYKGMDVTANLAILDSYPDANNVSNYAKEAVAWAVENGLISGTNGNLAPKGNATRGQCAKMILATISIIE